MNGFEGYTSFYPPPWRMDENVRYHSEPWELAPPPSYVMAGAQLPQPGIPGWHLGDVASTALGPQEAESWWTTGKIALALGVITAAYFLYKASQEVKPMTRKSARAAGEALVTAYGARRGGGFRRSPARFIEAEPISIRPKWLER